MLGAQPGQAIQGPQGHQPGRAALTRSDVASTSQTGARSSANRAGVCSTRRRGRRAAREADMDIYASPDGADEGDGGPTSPWRLQKALDALRSAEHQNLLLYGGSYVGFFTVSGVSGSDPDHPKNIRSVDGERAIIDGTVDDFRDAPNEDWVKSPTPGSTTTTSQYATTQRPTGSVVRFSTDRPIRASSHINSSTICDRTMNASECSARKASSTDPHRALDSHADRGSTWARA